MKANKQNLIDKSILAEVRLTSLNSNVYGPSEDSFALADALLQRSAEWKALPKIALEIGCGTGYVVTSLARILHSCRASCHIICTDINESALEATRATLSAHKVQCTCDLIQGDLNGPLLHHKVDLLLFNPPYVPTPDEEIGRGGIAASWAGGFRGRVVIDRLLPKISDILSPSGEMLMVTVAENEPEDVLRQIAQWGLKGRICLTIRADEELLHILHIIRADAKI